MAINPVLAQDIHTKQLIPHCRSGEYILMLRNNTRFVVTVDRSCMKGSGDTVLTTHRIVFIKNRDKKFGEGFSSIALPYSHVDDPRFRQPLFGANYLEGTIRPVTDSEVPLTNNGTFNIYFDGGCATFLKGFYMYYARVRNSPNFVSNAHPFSEGPESNSAFVDPNDPTHVYFAQPETSPTEAAAEGQGDKDQEKKGGLSQTLRYAATRIVSTPATMAPFRI